MAMASSKKALSPGKVIDSIAESEGDKTAYTIPDEYLGFVTNFPQFEGSINFSFDILDSFANYGIYVGLSSEKLQAVFTTNQYDLLSLNDYATGNLIQSGVFLTFTGSEVVITKSSDASGNPSVVYADIPLNPFPASSVGISYDKLTGLVSVNTKYGTDVYTFAQLPDMYLTLIFYKKTTNSFPLLFRLSENSLLASPSDYIDTIAVKNLRYRQGGVDDIWGYAISEVITNNVTIRTAINMGIGIESGDFDILVGVTNTYVNEVFWKYKYDSLLIDNKFSSIIGTGNFFAHESGTTSFIRQNGVKTTLNGNLFNIGGQVEFGFIPLGTYIFQYNYDIVTPSNNFSYSVAGTGVKYFTVLFVKKNGISSRSLHIGRSPLDLNTITSSILNDNEAVNTITQNSLKTSFIYPFLPFKTQPTGLNTRTISISFANLFNPGGQVYIGLTDIPERINVLDDSIIDYYMGTSSYRNILPGSQMDLDLNIFSPGNVFTVTLTSTEIIIYRDDIIYYTLPALPSVGMFVAYKSNYQNFQSMTMLYSERETLGPYDILTQNSDYNYKIIEGFSTRFTECFQIPQNSEFTITFNTIGSEINEIYVGLSDVPVTEGAELGDIITEGIGIHSIRLTNTSFLKGDSNVRGINEMRLDQSVFTTPNQLYFINSGGVVGYQECVGVGVSKNGVGLNCGDILFSSKTPTATNSRFLYIAAKASSVSTGSATHAFNFQIQNLTAISASDTSLFDKVTTKGNPIVIPVSTTVKRNTQPKIYGSYAANNAWYNAAMVSRNVDSSISSAVGFMPLANYNAISSTPVGLDTVAFKSLLKGASFIGLFMDTANRVFLNKGVTLEKNIGKAVTGLSKTTLTIIGLDLYIGEDFTNDNITTGSVTKFANVIDASQEYVLVFGMQSNGTFDFTVSDSFTEHYAVGAFSSAPQLVPEVGVTSTEETVRTKYIASTANEWGRLMVFNPATNDSANTSRIDISLLGAGLNYSDFYILIGYTSTVQTDLVLNTTNTPSILTAYTSIVNGFHGVDYSTGTYVIKANGNVVIPDTNEVFVSTPLQTDGNFIFLQRRAGLFSVGNARGVINDGYAGSGSLIIFFARKVISTPYTSFRGTLTVVENSMARPFLNFASLTNSFYPSTHLRYSNTSHLFGYVATLPYKLAQGIRLRIAQSTPGVNFCIGMVQSRFNKVFPIQGEYEQFINANKHVDSRGIHQILSNSNSTGLYIESPTPTTLRYTSNNVVTEFQMSNSRGFIFIGVTRLNVGTLAFITVDDDHSIPFSTSTRTFSIPEGMMGITGGFFSIPSTFAGTISATVNSGSLIASQLNIFSGVVFMESKQSILPTNSVLATGERRAFVDRLQVLSDSYALSYSNAEVGDGVRTCKFVPDGTAVLSYRFNLINNYFSVGRIAAGGDEFSKVTMLYETVETVRLIGYGFTTGVRSDGGNCVITLTLTETTAPSQPPLNYNNVANGTISGNFNENKAANLGSYILLAGLGAFNNTINGMSFELTTQPASVIPPTGTNLYFSGVTTLTTGFPKNITSSTIFNNELSSTLAYYGVRMGSTTNTAYNTSGSSFPINVQPLRQGIYMPYNGDSDLMYAYITNSLTRKVHIAFKIQKNSTTLGSLTAVVGYFKTTAGSLAVNSYRLSVLTPGV